MYRARVLTLNIWQQQGPHQARIELCKERLAALGADVICLQEVRQLPGEIPNQAATLADALGMDHVYETAQPWGGGDEGLAILSRHPIEEHGARELPHDTGRDRTRRVCLGARVGLPGGAAWFFTTHLAFRLEDGALRERQVVEADRFARELAGELPAVLCGDFNAPPEADEIRYLRGLTSLQGKRTYYQDAFASCNPGVAGHTWTRDNPYTAQLGWFPSRRLDYIFVAAERSSGVCRIQDCRIVCTEPDLRGVLCSDHYGLLAEVDLVA